MNKKSANLLSAVRHWWLTLLVAVLLAAGAGYLFSAAMPMTHEARVRLMAGPTVDSRDGLDASGQLVRTYGELVTGAQVVEGTIAALDLPHHPDALREAIRPTADGATRMLIVRVRDLDADRAALIANELATQLQALIDSEHEGPGGELLLVDQAASGIPIGIPTVIIVGLAGFAGVVVALTLVFLLENLNQAVRDEEELAEVAGVDYLGHITPMERLNAPQGFVVETAPDSLRAGEYRMLATKVELIANRDGLRSLLVLGVGRARGSGDLTANMAKVLAERHHCVTLVDANPVTQEITSSLRLRDHLGLTDMLELSERNSDEEPHPGAFTFTSDPRLFIVPFGRAGGHLSPHATAAPTVLDRLRLQADFVLVNAAPADRSAASLVWAGAVDGTVLVVPRNRAKRSEVTHMVESLRLVGAKVIGVVFEEPRPLVASGVHGSSRTVGRSPTANDGGSVALDPPGGREDPMRPDAPADQRRNRPTDGIGPGIDRSREGPA